MRPNTNPPWTAALTILIPAFDEERTVANVVTVAVASQLGTVIVVSDGSRDKTAARAREAGANVIELPRNQGKGGAVAAGLQATTTPLVMLLDADLKDLQPQHLHQLLEPLRNQQADTTAGLFSGGRSATDFGNRITPTLSGQRVIPRSTLERVQGLAHSKYAIELAIGDQIKAEGLHLKYVQLEGVSQVMKEEKRGLMAGLLRRLRMYWHLARYTLRKHLSRG